MKKRLYLSLIFIAMIAFMYGCANSSEPSGLLDGNGTGSGIDSGTYNWTFSGPGTVTASNENTATVTISDCSVDGVDFCTRKSLAPGG